MMKRIVLPVVLLLWLLPSAVFGADAAGSIVLCKGAARIVRDARSMNAELGAQVMQGDTITTQANATVKVLFKDDSVITIAQTSSFSVSEYLYNAPKSRSLSLFKLLYGKLRAVVGRSSLKVETETAVAGVKGTVFEVWVDSATHTTMVAVIEGSVELKNIRPEIKGASVVTGGNASSVASGEPPTPPAPYTPPSGQPGAPGQGDGTLPDPEMPPAGTGALPGGQVMLNIPPIHQTPQGFSRVGIQVVFP
jgi:hypothetical protein